MRRFKQWLILKLGGFLSQEVVEYRPFETESRELTAFAVRRDGMTRPEQSGDEDYNAPFPSMVVIFRGETA